MPTTSLTHIRTRPAQALAAMLAASALAIVPFLAATPVRAAEHTIDIAASVFAPGTLTVAAGDTVTWRNSDDAPHTVTDENGAFDSGNMDTGATFSFTFTELGTYEYRCDYHSEMQATIVVQAATEAAPAASAPPAGSASATATHAGAEGGAGQPDTALPTPPTTPAWLVPLLIGLGLVALAFGVVPSRSTSVVPRPTSRGGWRR